MSLLALFWIAMTGLVFLCLASIATRSLAEFSPHELQELYRKHAAPDRLGHIFRWRDRVGLAVRSLRMLTTAVVAVTGTFWILRSCGGEAPPSGLLLTFSVLAGATLLLAAGIWLPWAVARVWAEPFLFWTWRFWWGVSFLVLPLVLAGQGVEFALHRLAGHSGHMPDDEESFEDDIRSIVTEGHREGLLEEEAREMIEGVIELGDVDVSQIMTPRTDMVSLPASLSWPEMIDTVVSTGHTRMPVYGRSRDDIVGILHAKDLLAELAKASEQRVEPWTKLLRDPVFVPETKPVDELLQELQRSRNHMVVVLDEYGGVAGLVTIEDVLEEIVGEIGDEYDTTAEGFRELGPGLAEAEGRVRINEINERLALGLPEDADYDTIGGLVFSALGHVPVAGETVVTQNVRLTVLQASRRRIERVRIEVLDPAANASEEAQEQPSEGRES